jgi:hypothetical protein
MIETIECRMAPNETCIEASVQKPMSFEINGEKVYLVPEQDEKCRKCSRSVQMPVTIIRAMVLAMSILPVVEYYYQI